MVVFFGMHVQNMSSDHIILGPAIIFDYLVIWIIYVTKDVSIITDYTIIRATSNNIM